MFLMFESLVDFKMEIECRFHCIDIYEGSHRENIRVRIKDGGGCRDKLSPVG